MFDFALVDAHIHLVEPDRLAYSWMDGAPSLRRRWAPDDLARAARPYEIERFVFVEVDVDADCRRNEAEWVDGLARSDLRVAAGVYALALERGGAIGPELAKLAALPSARGVRRLIQHEPDPEFMLRAPFLEALQMLPRYNLSFDICVFHPQLNNVVEMVRRCPEVSFVLDHLGKPGVKAGLTQPWRDNIAALADCPNVVCKLSGLHTEDDSAAWSLARLRPYIDHVVDRFGPDRILYGGDWPVSELAGAYLQWLTTLALATQHFSPEERRKLFRDNAVRVYRLDGR